MTTAKFKKKLILAAGSLFALLMFPSQASAQPLQPAEINFDNSIIQEDRAYSVPREIIITPMSFYDESTIVRDENWFKGLYYYLVANENHPGFTDIPFHYVVSNTGKVFQGNAGGDERKVNISGIGTDILVIGYLTDSKSTGFDLRAEDALGKLVADVASLHNIPLNRVSVHGVRFVRNSEQQTVSLEREDVFGLWNSSLQRVKDKARENYKPRQKKYELKIVEVSLPSDEVESGTSVNGAITVKNSGKFGIYYDTLTEIIASRQSANRSQFYLNGEWLSISQFSLMKEGDVILPGEELKFEFKLATPLYFGELAETFVIKNAQGRTLANTKFNVKLKIKRPKGTIVQIRETPVGYLRVRSAPDGLSNNEIARVSPGQRFFQTGTNPAGWIRIKLNDGRQGWVSRQYISYV